MRKKQKEKLQNAEMMLALHPNLKKADLMRSESMINDKNEIKKLTNLVKLIQGKYPSSHVFRQTNVQKGALGKCDKQDPPAGVLQQRLQARLTG